VIAIELICEILMVGFNLTTFGLIFHLMYQVYYFLFLTAQIFKENIINEWKKEVKLLKHKKAFFSADIVPIFSTEKFRS